jgi:mannonate dehydratase
MLISPTIDIAVVGGGPAGLVAATVAAQAGASVEVFERDDRAGGILGVQSQPLQGPSTIFSGVNGFQHCQRLRDAADEVHRVAEAGAVAVKWLPNAQRFDPASAACDSFYRAMTQRGLVLITHAGYEMAVESADAQRFGDPLRLRRALDAGVQVVVAHCASSGTYPDGDDPDGAPVSAFDLFLRLMDTPEYHGRLFGEISAVTLFNRVGGVLRRLLERTDLHDRLIHGSDYPLPAIDPLIQTWQLVAEDLVSPELRAPLSALFDQNPLLFDLVLKRTVCLGGDERTRFPARMFQGLPGLFSA